jgi:glutaredoxin
MKVIIFTTKTCPRCHQLEELLKKKGIIFQEKLLEIGDNTAEMLFIGGQTHQPRWSSPILCVDDKFIESGKEEEWIEGIKVDVEKDA